VTDRVADLKAVDLVVAIVIETDTRVGGVIRKRHSVGRHESAGANTHTLVGLIGDPVLVGDERRRGLCPAVPHSGVRRLSPDGDVSGPAVLLQRADEVRVHQEVDVLMPTRKADAQVRGTQLQPQVHGAEHIPQGAKQECRLAGQIVGRVRRRTRRAAARRELSMGEEPSIRGQEPTAGR
jgi:hypothetical protein